MALLTLFLPADGVCMPGEGSGPALRALAGGVPPLLVLLPPTLLTHIPMQPACPLPQAWETRKRPQLTISLARPPSPLGQRLAGCVQPRRQIIVRFFTWTQSTKDRAVPAPQL